MRDTVGATRRRFLKLAAIFLGGIGAATAIRSDGVQAAAVEPARARRKTVLKLYGQHWHLYSHTRKQGDVPVRGDQMAVYGELLKDPQGVKMGEFYSNCLSLQSPFGPTPFAAANIEVHTFNLVEGTILGMGATKPAPAGESIYTVVGGTGKYAGVAGTYTAHQRAQELGGDGTAEFAFDLTI